MKKRKNYFQVHLNKKPKRKLKKDNLKFIHDLNKIIVRAFELVQSFIGFHKSITSLIPLPKYKQGSNETGLKIVNDYFNPGEIGVERIVLKDGSFSVISQGMNNEIKKEIEKEKLILELQIITGFDIDKIKIELSKIKCDHLICKDFFLAKGRFPFEPEQQFISKFGFNLWYNFFSKGLLKD